MEGIAQLQASQRAHKAHITKVLKKANDFVNTETHVDKNMALASLQTALEQLMKKRDILRELDAKIVAEMEDPTELEREIFESEEISYELEENISHIRKYIEVFSLPSPTHELSKPAASTSTPQATLQQDTTQETPQEPSTYPSKNTRNKLHNKSSHKRPVTITHLHQYPHQLMQTHHHLFHMIQVMPPPVLLRNIHVDSQN
jgi:hypothetical protein